MITQDIVIIHEIIKKSQKRFMKTKRGNLSEEEEKEKQKTYESFTKIFWKTRKKN